MEISEIKCSVCPYKHVNGWIPTKTRYPANKGWYLVTLSSGVVLEMQFEKTNKFWDKSVIAWRELPPAYKEGAE